MPITFSFADILPFEAEDIAGVIHTTFYGDPTSWGNAYIDLGTSSLNSIHTFTASSSNNYNFWIRLKGANLGTTYSAILNVNGQEIVIKGNSTGWQWINKDSYQNALLVHFNQGQNTFSLRKDPNPVYSSPLIDSIIITDYLNFIPPDTPPQIINNNWIQVVSDGFDDTKNHEAKLMDTNGSLYASTSNTNLHPAIYKSDDGTTFNKVYELKTPYGNGCYMYRTLDLKYLDLSLSSCSPAGEAGLYAVSDDWYGTCYLTKLNSDNTFTTIRLGNRDWWTKDIIAFNGYAYAGFYNDWNLWFTMRRSNGPMNSNIATSWLNISQPAFGKDASNKQYANMDSDASCVFRGYLYIGTYNYGYFGRATTGAQIWRTNDGTTWEKVVGDGFGSTSRSSISHMTIFGGYLYATTAEAFGPNYIYRTRDGINWELAYQGMNNEPYIGDITSYMGRLYLTTYNWGGKVYSSPDGTTWTPVSNSYINNNSANSLVGDLHPFRGSMYVNTRNMTAGTNIFRGKLFLDLVLNPISNKSVYEDQLLDFTINASGEPLIRYSASNLPEGSQFDTEAHKFSWKPSYGQAGIYSNTHFEVSDGLDNLAYENISIEVLKTVIHGDLTEEGPDGMEGVKDASVQVLDETQTNVLGETLTDENGHFNIFNDFWANGVYFIRIIKPSYENTTLEININDNSTDPLNPSLTPYVRIMSPCDGATIYTEP